MKFVKRIIKAIMIFAIAFCLIIGLINLYVVLIGKSDFSSVEDIEEEYDCAIVLGAKVGSDGTPSYMLRDRLDFAFKMYDNGTVPKILVSGDHGTYGYDEVNAMRQYLIEKGVKIEDVFMDHAGFDTYSTMYRAKDIFEVKRAVICTQKYHLYRACYIAKRMGVEVKGLPSDVYVSSKILYFKARECAARIKAFLEVEILKPEPMLGEKIPITGDGRITEDGKT